MFKKLKDTSSRRRPNDDKTLSKKIKEKNLSE
jgi:hypothetical protein